jgi:hypothetical protein
MINLEEYLGNDTREVPQAAIAPPVPMGRAEYELFLYKTLRHVPPRNTVVYQPYSPRLI